MEVPSKAARNARVQPQQGCARGKQSIVVHMDPEPASACTQKLFGKIRRLEEELRGIEAALMKTRAAHSVCGRTQEPTRQAHTSQPAKRIVYKEVEKPVERVVECPY